MVAESLTHGKNSGTHGEGGGFNEGTLGAISGVTSNVGTLIGFNGIITKINGINGEIKEVIGDVVENYSDGEGFMSRNAIVKNATEFGLDMDFMLALWNQIKAEGACNTMPEENKNFNFFNDGIKNLILLLDDLLRLKVNLYQIYNSGVSEENLSGNLDLGLEFEGFINTVFRLIDVEAYRLNGIKLN